MLTRAQWCAVLCTALITQSLQADEAWKSHAPMRPLPIAGHAPLEQGPNLFVDPVHGDDHNVGTQAAPWKTLAHALRKLSAGDTLVLRSGTYYEKLAFSRSGAENKPVTIRSFPGELAVIDGGLREFYESPATSWEPAKGGVEGEFVSTHTFPDADSRRAPMQFLPSNWEPLTGLEDQRPLAIGHFGDSMIPLHGYRTITDLRAANELWPIKKEDIETAGVYGGPGLWFNRGTGRIHVRLSHNKLEGLGDRAYRGETDPRKIPLVVAVGFGDDVARLTGIKHVRLHDLVFRGATGSPMVHIYGCENIDLDHVTILGGFPGLMINASKNIRVTNSAIRELAAPWLSRAHMKYRGTATYAIIFRDDQPINENIEIANCEFSDGHDFAFMRFVKNLQFHHNFADNFNDDGLECGPKLRYHTMYIYQNRISSILSPMTQHQNFPDESPLDHDPKLGEFLYRNLFDLRDGTYSAPPRQPDPTGAYLHVEGHLAGDHGNPSWPVIHFYQNTVIRRTPVFRDYYLMGLAVMGFDNTERDVFNNIFVQADQIPGVNFMTRSKKAPRVLRPADNLREGGNILWGIKEGPISTFDHFAKFRASPLFQDSKNRYEPGWTTQDRVVDPRFVAAPAESGNADIQLQQGSAAIKSGITLPAEWPDPLRPKEGSPDIGAIPFGTEPWGVGIDARVSWLTGQIKSQTAKH